MPPANRTYHECFNTGKVPHPISHKELLLIGITGWNLYLENPLNAPKRFTRVLMILGHRLNIIPTPNAFLEKFKEHNESF